MPDPITLTAQRIAYRWCGPRHAYVHPPALNDRWESDDCYFARLNAQVRRQMTGED